MIDYKKLAGENIASIKPYGTILPLKKLVENLGLLSINKMTANENPLGTSPMAKRAVKEALEDIHIYPIGDAHFLREKLSKKLGISQDELIFGNGSNEIIEFIIRAFVKQGEHVMSVSPSFSVYGLIAQAAGTYCEWVNLKKDFSFDLRALADKVKPSTRVIFLCNPNNPTGTYFTKGELLDFLSRISEDKIVVLDEAYIEFVDANDFPDSLSLYREFPNIISLRTFSKVYGLAGLRVGYGFGHKEAIDMLSRVRQPFNVNSLGQIAATAALDDVQFVRETIKTNRMGKTYLYKEFKKLNLNFAETQANFILLEIDNAKMISEKLLKEGIIVRYFGGELDKYLRITIDTMYENEQLINKLKKVMES